MDIYKFDKSLAEYLEETRDILCCTGKTVPASSVNSEWAYSIELIIEPTGWNALWKISRLYCEEFQIKYPTVVYGTVQQVLFKELKAIFTINLVEDDRIHLPEEYEVPLTDLWVTKNQENSELNIKDTARCIDLLRFFYKNIWMPWDYECDDDSDWAENHLESRIHFYYDLKKNIKPALVSHIRKLLNEAEYLYQQKQSLENDLQDDEENNNKEHITKLTRLHLRMSSIKYEIKLLENPKTRCGFDEMDVERLNKFSDAQTATMSKLNPTNGLESTTNIMIVLLSINTIDKQMQYLEKIRLCQVGDNKIVQMFTTLQNCLESNNLFKEIFIPSGIHSIKYFDYINANSSINGITIDNDITAIDTNVVIESVEEDCNLLMINGDVRFENITLDCRKVRNGILLQSGSLTLKYCTLIGDEKSCTSIGCVALENTSLIMIDCVIKNFATAINCHPNVKVNLHETLIDNSKIGIDCADLTVSIKLERCKIINSKQYGIMMTKHNSTGGVNSRKTYDTIAQYREIEMAGCNNLNGDCEFIDNNHGNIAVYHRKTMLFIELFSEVDVSDSVMHISLSNENENNQSAITIESDSICSAIDVDDDSDDDEDDDKIIE